ncbi:hypothetical protein, partial [Achromobacter aegrifaciens]
SLLGRLWPCLAIPTPPSLDGETVVQEADGPEWQGEPLRRVDRAGLAQLARVADVAVSPGFGAAARGAWGDGG